MNSSNDSLAMQRITKLVDESSFMEIGSLVTARSTDFNLADTDTPSDGVITGHGLIDGNLVFVYSQNASVLNGTIGEMHAKKIAAVYDMAMKMGAPVIGFIDCAGMRLQESVDALDGFGQIYAKEIAASGVIPQISAIFGSCGGGLAVVPALCDFAFMENEKGKMFVNSPNAIEGNRIDKCDTSAAAFQSEENGCIDVVGTEDEIITQIRELVTMLPLNNEGDVYTSECTDDLNRACENMETMKGDPRFLLSEISDGHVFFETKAGYAKDMVTGFIKLNGMTVGAVANCTEVYDAEGNKAETFDSVLSARGCNKAAEFVQYCDAFEIPVLTLTNVTGFKACMCSEKNLAKALAHMTSAFASATCPKVNLITGNAYGSAYVSMNSKSIGADFVYAWKDAKVGMMDAGLAVKIMYADASADVLAEKAKEYEELQTNVMAAARRGYVDLVVEPADTRKYLVSAFELLYTKCAGVPDKKHGTKQKGEVMKKKLSLMLCLIIMALTMTACGTDPASVDYFGMGYEELKSGAEGDVAALVAMTDENRANINTYGTKPVINLLNTWDESVEGLGAYVGFGEFSVSKAQNTVTVEQTVNFEARQVIVTYVYTYDYETEQAELTDANVDLVYSLGEKMAKAGMNTLMGMGTVFCVLILISLIIYAFNLIPYIQKKFARRGESEAVENAVVTQIEQREEQQQLTDDLELVAVITAAIAAGTGASADSFVVRSIHRR